MEVVGEWLVKLLKDGPAGGLALGLVAWIYLGRALLKEKDARVEDWRALGKLADTYAGLISKVNERKASREIREAEKTGGGSRGGGSQEA